MHLILRPILPSVAAIAESSGNVLGNEIFEAIAFILSSDYSTDY